jgi:hypothetical protein
MKRELRLANEAEIEVTLKTTIELSRFGSSPQAVQVYAVTESGRHSVLCTISLESGISLWGSIDPKLGFPLDTKGRLLVREGCHYS